MLVAACQAQTAPVPLTGPAADIAYLASPALEGRQSGTAGDDSAAVFIARRYLELGLRGVFPSSCADGSGCPGALFQFFDMDGLRRHNVGAIVPGSDSALRLEYVVIGAHYDHLGRSPLYSRDPQLGFEIRPGADDNASGTAGVLELARRFAAHPARRSIIFVNFDAEELGLIGSEVFVEHSPRPIKSIVFMLNLDMIGRLRTDRLYYATEREQPFTITQLDQAAKNAGLNLSHTWEIDSRSDHASFAKQGIEVLALFTGFHSDYHKATDVAWRVNVPGLLRVVDVGEAIARAEADR